MGNGVVNEQCLCARTIQMRMYEIRRKRVIPLKKRTIERHAFGKGVCGACWELAYVQRQAEEERRVGGRTRLIGWAILMKNVGEIEVAIQ